MLPYKNTIDRIRESERVAERLNHHIQRYGLEIATCAHNVPEEKMGFHVFGDKFNIPDDEVKTQMFRYMSDNYEEVSVILQAFLKAKGQEQCDYVEYMSRDYAKADQLALYLCARRFQIHLALITKDRVWYTFDGEGDFSHCDIILVYKGANIWKNTTDLCLPPPIKSQKSVNTVKCVKKKSKYEHDPDYIPDESDSDIDVKKEEKPDILFPQPQPVINLLSDSESDLSTIPEDDELDSDDTIICTPVDESSDSDATVIYDSQENAKDNIVKVVPAKSYHYGVKGATQKVWKCTHCGHVCNSHDELLKHRADEHTSTGRQFRCTFPKCTDKFNSDAERSDHMYKVHGLFFQCSKCFKTFADKRNLNKHLKRHDPANLKYKCSLCSYAGLFPSELEMHMTGHVDHRPFKCHLCPKTYRTKGTLSEHIQVQHAADPWLQCDKCPQKFKGSKLLGIHQRTHGEPTFACDLCGERFKHYTHLTVHRRKCTTIVE